MTDKSFSERLPFSPGFPLKSPGQSGTNIVGEARGTAVAISTTIPAFPRGGVAMSGAGLR